MCGIAGIIRVTPAPPSAPDARRQALTRSHFDAIPEAWLDVLDESIKHRGPDGQGRFRDRAIRADGSVVDVALVHRRLSIIDHACGAQPMVSTARSASDGVPMANAFRAASDEVPAGPPLPPPLLFHGKPSDRVEYKPLPVGPGDDLVAVVFNGCIYNHRELRAELQGAGHEFVTDHSDTEVLLHGWREWKAELPARLNGMFAWSLWDRSRALLMSTRDSFGEKPLYGRGGLFDGELVGAACSCVPGLAALPWDMQPGQSTAPRGAVYFALHSWIRFGWSPVPPMPSIADFFPGTVGATGDPYGLGLPTVVERWAKPQGWHYPWRNIAISRKKRASSEEIDGLLMRAVASRLEADVPVACFLSGGVDSSLTTAYARSVRPDIVAYTVRMPDVRYDESEHAATVARHLGVRHEILSCDAKPAEDLVRLIDQLGLPFGDSSLLPTYWVATAARERVKVALSGDGADELFAGYERYRGAHYLALLGPLRCFTGLLGEPLEKAGPDPKSTESRRARFWSAAAGDGYLDLIAVFPKHVGSRLGLYARLSWIDKILWTGLSVAAKVMEISSPLSELAWSQATANAIRYDLVNYLPQDIFRKTDTASMSVALEVRTPFTDKAVVELASRATIRSLMPNGQRKGLLRQVARKYLPAEIVDRPKQGFAIPIGEWFRSDYGGMKTLLLDRLNSVEPFGPPSLGIDLNRRFIQQMIDEHMGRKRDHSQRLYMLLVLSLWTDSLKS